MTISWEDFHRTEPVFAGVVEERFKMFKHHVLATLRKDGSPRATGIEVDFRFGQMWIGMMPRSRKALDLLRDPRFAIQANPGPDAEMAHGDVRVCGRAVEETEPAVISRFIDEVKPPEPFHLFRVDLTEVVRVSLDGDALLVESWHPGGTVTTTRRGTEDPTPPAPAG